MRYIIIPVCLLLMACDPNAVNNHTPVLNKKEYHQYFLECMDRLDNLPGRQQIKYNSEEIAACRVAAEDMATTRNDSYQVTK